METRDNYCGIRRSTFDATIYFIVSNNDNWDKGAKYECPVGYRWLSTAEGVAIFGTEGGRGVGGGGGGVGEGGVGGGGGGAYVYYSEGGWKGYNFGGVRREAFVFSDSDVTDMYKHVGNLDSYPLQRGAEGKYFAGLVCVREEEEEEEEEGSGEENGVEEEGEEDEGEDEEVVEEEEEEEKGGRSFMLGEDDDDEEEDVVEEEEDEEESEDED